MTPQELRDFKERHGLHTEDLAWLLQVTRRSVDRWLSGQHPPAPVVGLVLAAYDQGLIDPAWLASRIGAPRY